MTEISGFVKNAYPTRAFRQSHDGIRVRRAVSTQRRAAARRIGRPRADRNLSAVGATDPPPSRLMKRHPACEPPRRMRQVWPVKRVLSGGEKQGRPVPMRQLPPVAVSTPLTRTQRDADLARTLWPASMAEARRVAPVCAPSAFLLGPGGGFLRLGGVLALRRSGE